MRVSFTLATPIQRAWSQADREGGGLRTSGVRRVLDELAVTEICSADLQPVVWRREEEDKTQESATVHHPGMRIRRTLQAHLAVMTSLKRRGEARAVVVSAGKFPQVGRHLRPRGPEVVGGYPQSRVGSSSFPWGTPTVDARGWSGWGYLSQVAVEPTPPGTTLKTGGRHHRSPSSQMGE